VDDRGTGKLVADEARGRAAEEARERVEGTRKTVLVAFAGNLIITVAKFIGAYFSGSVAMFAEGLHSVVDTFNQVFLYLGLALEDRPASDQHPFGHGKERFFWSFVAAIFIFTTGALVSLYEGITKFFDPHPLHNVVWGLGTLAFSFVMEALSFRVCYSELKTRALKAGKSTWLYFMTTNDPTLAAVVVEEGAAQVGIAIAIAGVSMSVLTNDTRWDAAASIGIGILLMYLAYLLGNRSRSLLLGQGAAPDELVAIHAVFEASPYVDQVIDCFTMQLGPDELLLAAHLYFRRDLSLFEIEDRLDEIEEALTDAVPTLKRIFLEAENAETVERKMKRGQAI
jgi:cation diffusion facilitator family transporter